MIDRINEFTCIRENIDENIFIYTGCKTSVGELKEVLFCYDGIYIVLEKLQFNIRTTCQRLREILKTQYIYIYVIGSGYYDYFADKFIEKDYEDFFDETYNELYSYTDEEIELIEKRLRLEDAESRGSYVDDEGNVYIKKGSVYRQLADIDSDKLFYMCLFFGSLGFHRFRLKKYFSGIAYLFSFGFFGVGWAMDLFSIYYGIQTDNKNRLLSPVQEKMRKLMFIPLGVILNVAYLRVALELISRI